MFRINCVFVCIYFLDCFSESSVEKREPAPHCDTIAVTVDSSSKPQAGPSDGERMTAELGGIVTQFIQKVSLKIHHDKNAESPPK